MWNSNKLIKRGLLCAVCCGCIFVAIVSIKTVFSEQNQFQMHGTRVNLSRDLLTCEESSLEINDCIEKGNGFLSTGSNFNAIQWFETAKDKLTSEIEKLRQGYVDGELDGDALRELATANGVLQYLEQTIDELIEQSADLDAVVCEWKEEARNQQIEQVTKLREMHPSLFDEREIGENKDLDAIIKEMKDDIYGRSREFDQY